MANFDIGKILGTVVEEIVTKTLTTEAKKTTNDMKPADVPKIEPKVTAAVTKAVKEEIGPIIENQTNQEPWYKSRVTRGAIAVIISTGTAAFLDWYEDGEIVQTAISTYITTIGGALYTIYGRFTSAGTPTI